MPMHTVAYRRGMAAAWYWVAKEEAAAAGAPHPAWESLHAAYAIDPGDGSPRRGDAHPRGLWRRGQSLADLDRSPNVPAVLGRTGE